MTIESVTWVNDLDPTYPAEGETGTLHEGNNHIRNIKTGLKNSFPNIGSAMSASAGVLNKLIGLTATAGDLNILVGAAAAGLGATSIVGLAGLTATAGELNIIGDVTVTAAQLNSPTFIGIETLSGRSLGSIGFTGIPSWASRVTVIIAYVSGDTAPATMYIRLGNAGGILDTDYFGARGYTSEDETADAIEATTYANIGGLSAAGDTVIGVITFTKEDASSGTWLWSGTSYTTGTSARVNTLAGQKTVNTGLTQLQVGLTTGVFDSGSVNVMYE